MRLVLTSFLLHFRPVYASLRRSDGYHVKDDELSIPKIPDFLIACGRVRSYEHFKWRIVNKNENFAYFALQGGNSHIFARKLKVPK